MSQGSLALGRGWGWGGASMCLTTGQYCPAAHTCISTPHIRLWSPPLTEPLNQAESTRPLRTSSGTVGHPPSRPPPGGRGSLACGSLRAVPVSVSSLGPHRGQSLTLRDLGRSKKGGRGRMVKRAGRVEGGSSRGVQGATPAASYGAASGEQGCRAGTGPGYTQSIGEH